MCPESIDARRATPPSSSTRPGTVMATPRLRLLPEGRPKDALNPPLGNRREGQMAARPGSPTPLGTRRDADGSEKKKAGRREGATATSPAGTDRSARTGSARWSPSTRASQASVDRCHTRPHRGGDGPLDHTDQRRAVRHRRAHRGVGGGRAAGAGAGVEGKTRRRRNDGNTRGTGGAHNQPDP